MITVFTSEVLMRAASFLVTTRVHEVLVKIVSVRLVPYYALNISSYITSYNVQVLLLVYCTCAEF